MLLAGNQVDVWIHVMTSFKILQNAFAVYCIYVFPKACLSYSHTVISFLRNANQQRNISLCIVFTSVLFLTAELETIMVT